MKKLNYGKAFIVQKEMYNGIKYRKTQRILKKTIAN